MKIGKYDISIQGDIMDVTDIENGEKLEFKVTEYDFDYWAELAEKNGTAFTDHLIAVFEQNFNALR